VTAIAGRLSRADRASLEREQELAELDRLMRQPGGLAEAPEPPPLHRRRAEAVPVTALTVTVPGPQGGLTAPARAIPGIRAGRSERSAAADAHPAGLAGEPLLDLATQAPDRRLGLAQLGDHPRLDGYLCLSDEGIEAVDAAGQDEISEPPLPGMAGHVTNIAVTAEPVLLHRTNRDTTTEGTPSS
jgi:hypothetical protein